MVTKYLAGIEIEKQAAKLSTRTRRDKKQKQRTMRKQETDKQYKKANHESSIDRGITKAHPYSHLAISQPLTH